MKKIIITVFLTGVLAGNLYGQKYTDRENTIEAHIAPGVWAYKGFGYTFSAGLDYSKRLTERWSLGTGFEQIALISNKEGKIGSWEDKDGSSGIIVGKKLNWYLMTIPFQLKFDLQDHLYIHAGPSMDIVHYNNKFAFGLGWRLGAGYEYDFDNGVSVSINPYIKWSGVFVESMNNAANFVAGISMKIGYSF